jgi:hypothetical protein
MAVGVSAEPEEGAPMKWKAFFTAALAVYAVAQLSDYLIHGVILRSAYEATKDLWRPDMDEKMWIMVMVTAIWSVLFTLIFIKGCEGRGLAEGVRFGLLIGLFTAIPMAYGTYAMLPIPYSLALQWFVYGMVQCLLLGVVAALIWGRLASPGAARPA